MSAVSVQGKYAEISITAFNPESAMGTELGPVCLTLSGQRWRAYEYITPGAAREVASGLVMAAEAAEEADAQSPDILNQIVEEKLSKLKFVEVAVSPEGCQDV